MKDDRRLYGLPGAEVMYNDLESAYESEIEGDSLPEPVEIEEWSVHPSRYHLPSLNNLLEWVEEWAVEYGEICGDFEVDFSSSRAKTAADNLLNLLADEITWTMADHKLASHWVTWDEAGEPLLDGKPMYVYKDKGE